MKTYLLPKEGKFYKSNLHTHTTVSDGRWTPEKVKEEYSKHGYSIVAFTDHDALCPHNELTDDQFLAINGFETYFNTEVFQDLPFDFVRTYHLSFFAKDKNNLDCPAYSDEYVEYTHGLNYVPKEVVRYHYKRQHSVECINRFIKQANAKGWLVSYNHPRWSLHNYEDYGNIEGLWGVEVANTGCFRGCMPDTEQPLIDFLRQGKQVFPICADDMHDYGSAFGAFTMIKAPELEYSKVLIAMEKGDFYATEGPLIHELYIEDGILKIECSDAVKVFVNTERRTGWALNATDKPITNAEFNISKYVKMSKEKEDRVLWKPYIRVTVVDAQGKKAYSRAYFVEEFDKQ